MFCWPCIGEWLNRSDTCPACGGHIDRAKLIQVFGQGAEADVNAPQPPIPDYHPPRGFTLPAFTRFRLPTFQTGQRFRVSMPEAIMQLCCIGLFVIALCCH
jgi:hypothetical protein